MTTTIAREAATRREPRDLHRFWRLLIAVVLPIGPLGVTVTRGIMPYWTSDDTRTMVDRSVAQPDLLTTMSWLALVFTPPLMLAMLVLGYVARRGAPVLATLGAGISFVSYANWSSGGLGDQDVLTLHQAGFDAAAIQRAVEASYEHPVAMVASLGWVIGHILGMILLGLALYRSRVVPRWVGVAIVACQPIHLIGAVIVPSRLLDVTLGWGLATVAFAMVSRAVVRME